MIYDITPVPKPRMTQRDKRGDKRPTVARYHAFKDECRLKRVKVNNGDSLTFVLPMPKSWSKKKRRELLAEPHQQTPDLDNLVKALWDAVESDDSHLWHIASCKKLWGLTGRIIIEEYKGEER